MLTQKSAFYCLIYFLSLLLCACSSKVEWLNESGRAASVPAQPDFPFEQYVENTRQNIRQILEEQRFHSGKSPYLGGYTSKEAATMRGPFQRPEHERDRCEDPTQGAEKGFLLIHGLTDSPYLMTSISNSLQKAYPCSLTRAVLLPGHGTVAGDSLNMNYEDWLRITDYGVRSFQKMDNIKELYLVGFSTGTALALKHLKAGHGNDKIRGLILISTAVKAKTNMAFAAGIVGMFKDWADTYQERDAARYESFSFNAGAQFYQLTKGMVDQTYATDIPVLMAVSADDDTIDALAARDFFCNYATSDKRALIWYESRYPEKNTAPACKDIASIKLDGIEREFQGTSYRFANYAHIALTIDPGDPHYGVNGKYRNCKYYEANDDPESFAACQQGTDNSIFGEKDLKSTEVKNELGYDYWRRGTFNPDYPRLEKSIICFTNDSCEMSSVLDLSK